MRNILIPFLLSDHAFQVREERVAFFVGNTREGVVGVFAVEVWHQFCELVGLAEGIDAVDE